MPDREKVIKGLQEAVNWLSTETSLTVIDQWVVRDALALLKAQEPCEDAVSRKDVINVLQSPCDMRYVNGNWHPCIGDYIEAITNLSAVAPKAQEPTQWHKEGCAKNSSVCVVDIGNDMPALLAAVVVNGRFIFDGLDITEKVRHWFAIPGIKAYGQAVKWE